MPQWVLLLLSISTLSLAKPTKPWPSLTHSADIFNFKNIKASLVGEPDVNSIELSVPKVVIEGERVILKCKANGSPPPVISWLKDGKPISLDSEDVRGNEIEQWSNGGMKTIQRGSTEGTLVIACATSDDQGVYTCVADNHSSKISKTVHLSIEHGNRVNICAPEWAEKHAPVIYMNTIARVEIEGANVQMFCRATNANKIQWKVQRDDGSEFITENDSQYMVLPNGDLLIREITFETSMADYVCMASNKYGHTIATGFLYPTD